MWGKVSCLRKQHNSNQRPSGLKSNALTTTPQRPQALQASMRFILEPSCQICLLMTHKTIFRSIFFCFFPNHTVTIICKNLQNTYEESATDSR